MFFITWYDQNNPDNGSNHGEEKFDSEETTLKYIHDKIRCSSGLLFTVIEGEEIELIPK